MISIVVLIVILKLVVMCIDQDHVDSIPSRLIIEANYWLTLWSTAMVISWIGIKVA